MPIYVDTFPQQINPAKRITLAEVVAALPEVIPFELNIWVGGRLARDGVTSENLAFYAEMVGYPSTDLKTYFAQIISPLGITATVLNEWRRPEIAVVRLYNKGKKILGNDLVYREPPAPITLPRELGAQEFKAKLPKYLPFAFDIYLTGSMARQGFVTNDLDFIIAGGKDNCPPVRKFFADLYGWKVDVGLTVMPEREPVYLLKLYEGGKCLL